jgi:hypothetical protein
MKPIYKKISCENIDDVLGNLNITKVKYTSPLLENWLTITHGDENTLTPTH